MKIKLSDHFTYGKLLRFTLPSIVMMIFTSIYGVVDGFFVSNFAGETPFAAINLIMPFLMIFGAVGFMVGAGGSALVSMTLGQGDREKAQRIFSLLVALLAVVGAVFTVLGLVFLEPVARLLGATAEMLPHCVAYGRIIMLALVPFMLQNVFQSFLVTAERPHFGLVITVAAGVTNMVLDAVFLGVFRWGVVGAAAATGLSQCVGGLIPLLFFLSSRNRSLLRLVRPVWNGAAVWKTCTNGASEFMTNISFSVVNMLYNFQLMRLVGEAGVAAFGVVMYISFIFVGVFLGFSFGSAPIVGFHYGAENTDELKSLLRRSFVIIGTFAVILTAAAELLAHPLALIFVSYNEELLALTRRSFMLYSISYLPAGFNIYGSSFFTALNNGRISALISFGRTLVFQVLSVFLLPALLGVDGVWLANVMAETLALLLTLSCLAANRNYYRYY